MQTKWDKTFTLSRGVNHKKVVFKNRYGITLAGDLYTPEANPNFIPVAVSGPFGAVKEQCSGLYAMTLAKMGFTALAFDPSFTGESGGEPRYMASPDINVEDFMAAVDYFYTLDNVNTDKICILGICGWGGLALSAASLDTRIKATVSVTMYDMSRVNANGYFDSENSLEKRFERKKFFAEQRVKDIGTLYERAGGVVSPLPDDAPFFVKDYYDYYKTERGYHPRSLNSNDGWNVVGCMSYMNFPLLTYTNEIKSAVLLIHGEKAHSRYFSEDAYKYMIDQNPYKDNKKLLIIPGATHTDLYDGGKNKVIPFSSIAQFLMQNT